MNKSQSIAIAFSIIIGIGISAITHLKIEKFSEDYNNNISVWQKKQTESKSYYICEAISEDCGVFPYETSKGFPLKSGSTILTLQPYNKVDIFYTNGFIANSVIYSAFSFLIYYIFIRKVV
jgi:hypothetical protein